METITEIRTFTRPCSCGESVNLYLTPDRFARLDAPAEHPEWALSPCPKCRLPIPFRLPADVTQIQTGKPSGFMAAAMERGRMTAAG